MLTVKFEAIVLRLLSSLLLLSLTASKDEKFDVCEERTGIAQKAKATQVGAKMVDKCFLPVAGTYKFSPKMFQRAAYKMCLVFRLCWHKYIPLKISKGSDAFREAVYVCIGNMSALLTSRLNPDWIETPADIDPSGLYYDGVKCARKHKIFTDDTAVALFAIKWVRDTLF
ncbi:uncharacterized protein LOC119377522 [Rhipicephalus sanguineus]|uniref:uncharacterized protein LOC119376261 n=1 Tax=Rhipicephalus sanguineus TaxID=34632 RepID=UPI00189335C6|nr:uncharacterized protein LOC119376261 [Rhipicephalus sanguineus]XP_037502885.1 uncharacterized protein LOC119377522 [Rhipicephalus sanguineus]